MIVSGIFFILSIAGIVEKRPCVVRFISIVDHVAKEYGLKDENLVLAGFSMGSTNMWNIMTHYPDKFPKALMISGRTMWDIELKAFKHCNLKIVLGTKDTNIPPKANKAKALW